MSGIWAVVPIKEFSGAKQRLTPRLSPQQRQSLAAIMVEGRKVMVPEKPM